KDVALVHLGDLVGGGLLAREDFGGVFLAVVLRLVAEAKGVGVVVPRALVAGDAVDDLELHLRMVDADGNELRDVARAGPNREATFIERRGPDVADADHEHFHAVLVDVEAAERFAEYFR